MNAGGLQCTRQNDPYLMAGMLKFMPIRALYKEDLSCLSNLRKRICELAGLLSQNLSYVRGERENGPNGVKRTFLNLGKAFLRALAKDLGLRDVRVMSNPGGASPYPVDAASTGCR